MNDELSITYETLYDLLRREETRAELQKLDKDFMDQIIEYVQTKQSILEQKRNKKSIFSQTEQIELEFRNIQKILKKIYEKREQKIIQIALLESRDNQLLDKSSLLAEEEELLDSLKGVLMQGREKILHKILEGEQLKKPKDLKTTVSETKEVFIEVVAATEIPKFVGVDLEIYGPFEKDQKVKLPEGVAKQLIKNKQAKEMK